MSLVQGQILKKFGFLCALYAVLGSQGIVVTCTAIILFSYNGLHTNKLILNDSKKFKPK